MSWAEHGVCRPEENWLFFPPPGRHPVEAKAICATCPVQEPCAAYALEHEPTAGGWGVWGGTTALERRRMREAQRVRNARRT